MKRHRETNPPTMCRVNFNQVYFCPESGKTQRIETVEWCGRLKTLQDVFESDSLIIRGIMDSPDEKTYMQRLGIRIFQFPSAGDTSGYSEGARDEEEKETDDEEGKRTPKRIDITLDASHYTRREIEIFVNAINGHAIDPNTTTPVEHLNAVLLADYMRMKVAITP